MVFSNVFFLEIYSTNLPIEIFLMICVMFLVGSMAGYCLEVLYRRFFSAKKWVNPGFMKGPWLPLYGFGLTVMFFLVYGVFSLAPESMKFYNPTGDLHGYLYQSGPTVNDLIPLSIMGVSMVLLEFLAGIIFVKGFKVRLWDYSNMRGNIMGIVCPLFSVIWFAVATIYYYFLNPFFYNLFSVTFNYIFGNPTLPAETVHLGVIFFLGIVYGIMLIDWITSANLFGKISKLSRSSGVVAKYEKLLEEHKSQRNVYRKKLIDSLPEAIVKIPMEKTAVVAEKTSKFRQSIRKILYIDPDAVSTSENYDDKGRPVHED